MKQNRRAFTLVELLVVVLIIGILAAIAVPQYQKAIDKSRMVNMMTLTRSLADAKRVYALANGTPPSSVKELDIDVPGECSVIADSFYKEKINCSSFRIFPLLDSLYSTSGWLDLSDGTQLRIYFNNDDILEKNVCMSYSNNIGRADDICKSFGKSLESGKSAGTSWRKYTF